MKIFRGLFGIVLITIIFYLTVLVFQFTGEKSFIIGILLFSNFFLLPILFIIKNYFEKLKEKKSNILLSSIVILICSVLINYSDQAIDIVKHGHLEFNNVEEKSIFYTFLGYQIFVNIVGSLTSYLTLKIKLKNKKNN